jgi:hypothetical protein
MLVIGFSMIVVKTGLLGFTESFFASSALAARERVAIAARIIVFFIFYYLKIKLMLLVNMELALLLLESKLGVN